MDMKLCIGGVYTKNEDAITVLVNHYGMLLEAGSKRYTFYVEHRGVN